MEQNSIFHERYQLLKLIGRGNFSEVWLANDLKTHLEVALKIYAPATGLDDEGLNVLAREFSLVVGVNHKNLLRPLYYDSCDRKPYLVLPYCKNGSTMKYIGKMDEHDAWLFIRDVAAGLAFLHEYEPPIIHQDIKPDNIMIGEKGEYMITDFGISTHARSTLRKSMSSAFKSAGTTAYMAPERFSRTNTPIMANDIYSVGASVFELLSGDAPFGDKGGLLQMQGAEVPELQGDYSPQMKKTIDLCLQKEPWQRPTAAQLVEYAETALNGGKIKFDEHSASNKKKTIIIASSILFCLAALISVFVVIKHNGKTTETDNSLFEQKAFIEEYDSLCFTCDSLVDAGADNNCDALLQAKSILQRIKDMEEKDSTLLKSQAISAKLQPKLEHAADAWSSAAKAQESLGESERATEYSNLAYRLRN